MRGPDDDWTDVFSRPTRLVVQGLTLTGVVVGSVAFAGFDKSVRLTVDGRTRTVHAMGGSVADVLAGEGLRVGGHDIVSPAPGSGVADGQNVVVRYGRPLAVTIDGREREYWTTALTVDEALQQVGLRHRSARLSVSRSLPLGRNGLALELDTRKSVILLVGGKRSRVSTYAATVADLVTERGLKVGGNDRLNLPTSTPLTTGAKIVLDRVVRRRSAGTMSVDFTTKSTEIDTLDKGTTKVTTKGKKGTAKVTWLDVYLNGERVSRKVLTTVVLTKPVNQVEQVGTRKPTVTGVPTGADGLNWAALAQCESGGNPKAVNPAGYYGLYQFSLATWARVGGSGSPVDASPGEQTDRAKILYARAGAGQWGCGSHLFD